MPKPSQLKAQAIVSEIIIRETYEELKDYFKGPDYAKNKIQFQQLVKKQDALFNEVINGDDFSKIREKGRQLSFTVYEQKNVRHIMNHYNQVEFAQSAQQAMSEHIDLSPADILQRDKYAAQILAEMDKRVSRSGVNNVVFIRTLMKHLKDNMQKFQSTLQATKS